MIYLLCFALSALFAWLAGRTQSKTMRIFWSVCSILPPVILAGLRDISVGIDVNSYLNKDYYWLGTQEKDFWHYLRYYRSLERGEIVFAFLLAVLSKITPNFRIFLFLSHAVIITGVYIGAWRQRKHANPVLILLLFYLLFFSHSLNVIRQYVAMAVIFAFLKDLEDGKWLRYCIVVAAMATIHSSALLAFSVPLVYFFLYGNEPGGGWKFGKLQFGSAQRPSMRLRQLLLTGALGFVVVFFMPLCQLLINAGVISPKYNFYMTGVGTSYSGIVSVLLVLELAAFLLFRRQMRETCPLDDFLLMGTVIYLLLQQLSLFVPFGRRIAAYYSLQNILTICVLTRAVPIRARWQRCALYAAVIVVALGYWWFFYVYSGASQTYPYLLGVWEPIPDPDLMS